MIENALKELDNLNIEAIDSIERALNAYKANPFSWARDYIYGIDKDYRLIKTSKISCFLHGDGDATLIHADGLDNFSSEGYKGKLKAQSKENRQFDFLVANPPYSISGFKSSIKNSSKDFELYDYLTDKSSEIEVLFIERMKQLLRDGGMAGIILPSSLLSNGGIYSRARKMLLRYFDFKAIVSLSGNAFMATGTNTIILFLERKSNIYWGEIDKKIKDFFQNFKDVEINKKAVSHYIKTVL